MTQSSVWLPKGEQGDPGPQGPIGPPGPQGPVGGPGPDAAAFVAFTEALASGDSPELTGWKRIALADTISNVGGFLSAQYINIWEFAYLITDKPTTNPWTWDWTPAFVAANAVGTPYVIHPASNENVIFCPRGRYPITSVTFSSRTNIIGHEAVFTPFDVTDAATHLIKIPDFCYLAGFTVDMNYAMNYESAIWVRGRHNHMHKVTTWAARFSWMVGDPAWATNPLQGVLGDSENVWVQCQTIWGITALKAYGQNTILHFVGCLMYSFKDTLPIGDPRYAAWNALEEYTMISWGAQVDITGGCMANFNGTYSLLRSEIQPVSGDPAYVNSFGRFKLTGTHIETGKLHSCAPVGAYPAEDDRSYVLDVSQPVGYVTTPGGNYIEIGGDCKQKVRVKGGGLYGLSIPNLIYALAAPCHIDPTTFSNITSGDFFAAFHALQPIGYSNFCPLFATSSSQAFSGTPSNLILNTLGASDVWSSFGVNWYSTSTGVFTAQTDLSNIHIDLNLQFTGAAVTDTADLILLVNGAQVDIASIVGTSPRANFFIKKVAKGSTIVLRVAQYQNRTLNGAPSNRMAITANT